MRLLLSIFLLLSFGLAGQNTTCSLIYCDTFYCDEAKYLDSLDFFERLYGESHQVSSDDQKLKLAYFVALSHYPELKNTRINLKLKAIGSTMQAQPKWDFLFRSRKNRNYQIFVNTNADYTGITYRDLTFNSLVGWLGHEMAHLADYAQKDNPELVRFIASYVLDKNELKRTERKADRATIEHGLGTQLLEGVNFFHRDRKVKNSYREKNKKYYLTPEEIVTDINALCSQN